jgi:hypothetical protein
VLIPAFPVNNSLLNASTSIDALTGVVVIVVGVVVIPNASRSGCSIVSNVFEKGFSIGALAGFLVSSSSERSDVTLPNGSSSSSDGRAKGCLNGIDSSPIVEAESATEGDRGGGD